MKEDEYLTVLEVRQYASTGNITDFGWREYDDKTMLISGGDVEDSIMIGGIIIGHKQRVHVCQSPFIGRVWYIEDPEIKKFKIYKANLDTSD